MAYTGHGHHIPGTNKGNGTIGTATRCGGVAHCTRCKSEVEHTISLLVGTAENLPEKAKDAVRKVVDDRLDAERKSDETIPDYSVYTVWFTKTLRNWKAMIGTTMDDDKYYEVTYNGEKRETYVDEYTKTSNTPIPD